MCEPRQAVKFWCLQALSFNRQRHHKTFTVDEDDILPEHVMDRAVGAMPDPPTREELMADDFIDALEGVSVEEHC